MTKKMLISLILIHAPCFPLKAQTVSNESALSADMATTTEKTFEELKAIFQDDPEFNYQCYDDGGQSELTSKEIAILGPQVFRKDLPRLKFHLQSLEEGFNIQVTRDVELLGELNCISGEQSGTCKNMTISADSQFLPEASNEEFEFFGSRNESWTFYVQSQDTLVAQRLVSLKIREKNFMGQLVKNQSVFRSQICQLSRISEKNTP